MKKKNYLITGGSGFIGAAITKKLVSEKNVKIKIFDSNLRGNFNNLDKIKKNITLIKGDIRDQKKLLKITKKIDCIIHLAFLNGTKNFYERPALVLDIGLKGIINIIDCCKINKIKELIIASSSEVYNTPKNIPTKESESIKIPDVFNPRYSYSTGKIVSEILPINNKQLFKKLIIFRPHNVYGPNMGKEHVIPELIIKIKKKLNKKKKKIIIFKIKGNGNETRTFNYIDDFVKGFMKILKKGKHLNIYNIGSTGEVRISKVVEIIAKNFNCKIKIKKTKLAEGSATRRCPDISKIKKLGYSPRVTLSKGIKKTFDWYNTNIKV